MVPEAETRGVLPGAKDGEDRAAQKLGEAGRPLPGASGGRGRGMRPADTLILHLRPPEPNLHPHPPFRSFVRAFVGTNTSVRKIPVGGGGGVFPAPAPCEAFSGFLAGTEARQVCWDPAIPQGGSRWHFPLFVGEAFVPAKKMLNVYIRSLLHIGLPLRSFEEGFRELTAGPPDRLTA